jgi:hypothetical protein
MTSFDNGMYKKLVTDLIGDIFYSGISNHGKIARIRTYAEVFVRHILLIPQTTRITLGGSIVKNGIERINNPVLSNSIETLRSKGNTATHTQDLTPVTNEDVEECVDALFDLCVYLLIVFFEKYEFGTNPKIMTSFSILPPIIRYKVLTYLFDKNQSNVFVIDKLALATLKAKNKKEVLEWVELNKDRFEAIETITNEQKVHLILKLGPIEAKEKIDNAPNIYDSCIEKINAVGNNRDKLPMYNDFESALPYYEQHGKLDGTSSDEVEFNSIMEFLYLGRKSNGD